MTLRNTKFELRKISAELTSYTPFTYANILLSILSKVCRNERKELKILDVGVGRGTIQDQLRLNRKFYSVGVDIFRPYLEEVKSRRRYDDVVLADAKALPFRDKTFNAVIALHLIEHLSKKDGFKLLKNLEQLSRDIVLLVTPSGHHHIEIVDDNPYQVHLSAWSRYEFKTLGYNVRGLWLKIIWGDKGIAKKLPFPLQKLTPLINYLFAPLSYLFPSIAGCIIAYKEIAS